MTWLQFCLICAAIYDVGTKAAQKAPPWQFLAPQALFIAAAGWLMWSGS
jgi:hypothetical protein